ncbi:uncharacterized protein BT62DRAFT_989773 [Guyanagaster necrorhizus]|uniref:Uncharacterized protein n=1 Tax=Guyanagaster necrorhizus TaxID=856835 RepID=A0A9P8AYN1_9AGAR|nr:uncharacterized protein BT62DRAFT_989773 [Guyanagaster necrorhizus MCA 3950]KAG7452675.1 hypothetical protein BT62DRAFT_989773 [Guyanagaster necrorhizus MCA 3950]
MVMHALYQEILPPSGVEFATSLKLTPSTGKDWELSVPPNASTRHELTARVLCNVVIARSNILRIFEVREELATISAQDEEEREKNGKIRKDTEAVESEVSMDRQGEGFVNIAKSSSQKASVQTVTKFYFLREHRLHGIVTGMSGVRLMASLDDKLDRLLISFRDAKIALMEWSDAVHDLMTVSIHTYERAPQVMFSESGLFRANLRVDPLSRCAALSLPKDSLAILPFYQTQAELEVMDHDHDHMQSRDIPYSPSFILDLPASIDKNIKHVVDFSFLPGFNNPTMAVLFQTQQTWAGRLKEFKDTFRLVIFTLDILSQNFPIITSVVGLPYDCLSILPTTTVLGGVVVVTSNALIYVDQAARRITLPVNGWASRTSDLPFMTPPGQEDRDLSLEGSRSVFVDDKTLFITLKDGTVYPVEIVADGKTVSKLVMSAAIAQTAVPSLMKKLDDQHIFIASMVGPSVLVKATKVEEEVDDDEAMDTVPTTVVDISTVMDVDDDDDIYGSSTIPEPEVNGATNGVTKKKRTVIHLSLCDTLFAYGPISGVAFSVAKNGDRSVPELVAATGIGPLGGFTLFQRDLPFRTKRKLHAIGGARGMWSLPIRQPVKSGGVTFERPINPFQADNDTLIISTDANPAPGLSRIAIASVKNDISFITRIPVTTVGAGTFFQRTALLHVMTNAIRVLEPDGTERQSIKDMDGNTPRAKIRACSISEPFVLILREDDSIGLFIETDRGKIRRKDMSPMGDKTSRYLTGCFFTDFSGVFEHALESSAAVPNNAMSEKTSTLQSVVNSGHRTQWLLLVRPQGILEIWALPKLMLVFSTSAISTLQNILTDSHDPPSLSVPQDPPRKPQDLDIEQALVAPLGESTPQPHLFVFLRNGQMAVYQILPAGSAAETPSSPRASTLKIKFVKTYSKAFEIQRSEETERSAIAEQKRISRTFIPFVTTCSSGASFSGVFFTGDNPSWIIASDKGGVQLYPSGHGVVHSFTPCSLWESKGDFLIYSEEGPSLLEWIPDFHYESSIPTRSVPRGRFYSSVIFDPSTSLIVAASSLEAKFASFDEDGNKVWEPDASNVGYPMTDCSTLELISPDLWISMDGFEFASNEFVNATSVVSLETSSTDTGSKDFIAVGTSINRGEDLATKGCTYIFEIVEVVPDQKSASKRWYKLRLRCRDDAKGPVTAICGFKGYLVSSMGQKIFVRAFDSDERLVGVAFLDVGVYVTSLRSLKNLLLIGDAVKSVSFVAFQVRFRSLSRFIKLIVTLKEDPYKLVVLAKDLNHVCVTNVDFFFQEDTMSIVTCDEEGVIRMYEYNPQDPDSRDGRSLLLRTEYQSQAEYRASVMIAYRRNGALIPEAKLIYGSTNGSIASLTPLDEPVAKRLQLLQGQLTRNIQHAAALNPKVFRIVRNDFVSRPLTKGILDGNLLEHFGALSTTRQVEMTRQIGTERTVILRDWVSLSEVW